MEIGSLTELLIRRHWDAIWVLIALIVEALLLLWLRGDLEAWALAALITVSAWALSSTARLWQVSDDRPDWLVLLMVANLILLAVVVGSVSEASARSPDSLLWYLPVVVVCSQLTLLISVAPRD